MIKTRLTGAEFEKLKQNRDAVFDARVVEMRREVRSAGCRETDV